MYHNQSCMARFVIGAIGVFVLGFLVWTFLITRSCESGTRFTVITKSGKSYTYRDLFFARQYLQNGSTYIAGDAWSEFTVNTERGVLQIPRDFNNVNHISFLPKRAYFFPDRVESKSLDSPPPQGATGSNDYFELTIHFKNGDEVIGGRDIRWNDYIEASSKRGDEKIALNQIVTIERTTGSQ